MAANKPDFSLGRVNTPDVGGGLLDFADRQQKQYQIGLSNAVEADKLLRDRQRFAREQELNARADTEYNREVSGRKALQDYASKPLDISTMLGIQTKTADEALIADANRRVALWDKSLADNKITQDDVDKGRVSKELLGKLYNPALDVNASTGIQKTYESVTPFREDVESRVEKDLIAQNVDPLKAKQYAQMEGQKYQSIPEYQAMLTAQAEKMTNNSKEQFKDNLELTKFSREVYKDELDKYKIKMDNLTKMMGSTGSGGTGGGGGLLGQDKSKAYDEVYSKAGNSDELVRRLDAAFQVYGAKAVNNALAASGINEPVRLLEWDVGKRDASLERFDNALKNEKPLSEVQGQFGNGAPNAPTYSLPTPATVYTADSARAAAQDRVKNSVLGYLGDSTSKSSSALLSEAAKGTTEKKSGDTLADRNNNYGNIKYDPKDNWIGGHKDPNSAFVKFDTPELGARALAKTIINGSAGLTIDQYINKYAPASDNNDTKSYIADVAKALNKKPDELIKSEDVPAVMKAIVKREGGNYSDDVLKEGYRLAVNPTTQDKDMLSKVMERGSKKDSAFLKAIDPSNIKDNYNNQVHTNVPPSIIAELFPKEQKPIEVISGFKQIGDIMSEGLKTTYEEGKKGAKEFVIPLVKPAYDNLFGKDDSQKINTGKALLNNSAAGMLEIAGSPYTAMKRFTDYMVYGESQGDSVFQKNAQNARATAISELNKSGIENPSDQEIAMFVSDVLMPVGGLAKTGKTAIGLMPKLETDYGKLLTNVATKDANVASATEKLNASKRGAQYADEAKEFERQALQKERQAATNTPESVRNTTSELVNTARREDVVIRTSKNILEGINTKGPLSAADQVEILNALETLQKVTSRSAIEVLKEMKLSPKVERYIMDSLRQTK